MGPRGVTVDELVRPDADDPVAPSTEPRRRMGWLRRHWLFVAALLAGTALRVMAQLAYRPALLFVDSWNYLTNVRNLNPQKLDPIGYPAMLLKPVLWVGNLATVAGLQHLLGLAMAVALYVVLQRNGVRPWLAALAVIPVLLDAYQIQIEQNIMSDTLFEALIVAGVVVLLWQRPPTRRALIAAGLILGIAVAVRTVGIVLVVPAALYAVMTTPAGLRRRRTLGLVAAFAVPVLLYASYYSAVTGSPGLVGGQDGVLYGRAAAIADCATIHVPSYERLLCPTGPRNYPVDDQSAHDLALLARIQPPPGMTRSEVERDFALRVFRQQPLALVQAVGSDFLQGFSWSRTSRTTDVPVSRWQFQLQYPVFPPLYPAEEIALHGGGGPAVNRTLAEALRDYQLHGGYLPGPFVALGLLLGLLAAAGVGRARRSPLRAACLLTALTGVGVLLAADLFEFSWRYQLPGLIFGPLAGVLGVSALVGVGAPEPADRAREADQEVIDAFEARHRSAFAPVVVVIAAYNEAESIGAVLDGLPRECGGLGVDALVVVDGGTDATARVAGDHGATVCELPENRGQGAALRVGYAIAPQGGARYVVTTDADGQYVGSELPTLLEPLLLGTADFVTGSRWLGQQDTTDHVRRLGSRFFAWVARRLTGQRITDTSFGFRAMTVEVPASLELRQAQYQSSELLMGAIAHGYRIAEVPMTQRVRAHGQSKKGHSLRYGASYARVLVGTWVRERAARARRRRPAPSDSLSAASPTR
ncbi:MAG TPA: glycosyltransferase [Acidimicrobiia bacterium]